MSETAGVLFYLVAMIGIGIASGVACYRTGHSRGWREGFERAEQTFYDVLDKREKRIIAGAGKPE